MTTPHKSTRRATEKPEAEVMDTFVPFYAKNMDRLAELQKKSLDMAAEQSTELMDAWKRVFRYVPDTPGMFLFDLFGQMFERCVETQKGAIDMTVEQTHAMTDLAKERGGSMAKMTGGMTHLFQQSVEHSVAAQKKALDYYAEQHKTAYETAKRQFRMSNPAAEVFQSGLDTLIETQKAMLDIATKPLKHAATV